MKYKGTLIAVKDLAKAKAFYKSVLDLDVIMDAGANVELTGGVFLQTLDTWVDFIRKPAPEVIFSNHAMELYFETDDMESFVEKLKTFADIEYVHPPVEHSWGQRTIRFFDADGHIIEVGENMVMVIQRFLGAGLTLEQTAARMDVDIGYLQSVLEQ